MAETKSTPLKVPSRDPHNLEATKYYIFNETGNIMISSTVDSNEPIEKSVQDIFAEVSVFFAAMTKAISTTINPVTKKPYSIYNYTALNNVISGSGLFVHVTEEDVTYKSSSFGMDFSKEMIEALLGLATGAGEMSFASAMVASLGREGLAISESHSSVDSKVANIVFVCEYLLGMPIVSALVVYADVDINKQYLKIGPCFKEETVHTTWQLHKDTYLFVTPTFIREYATDLDSAESNPAYNQLVSWLQSVLQRTPTITGVYTTGGSTEPAPTALVPGTTYAIEGSYLPMPEGTLSFGKGSVTVSLWTTTRIEFKVSGTLSKKTPIEVVPHGETTPVVATPGDGYTISTK